MPRLILTTKAEGVLRKRAQLRDPSFTPEKGDAWLQPSGCYSIEFSQNVINMLNMERAEGETYSDVIIRLAENEA